MVAIVSWNEFFLSLIQSLIAFTDHQLTKLSSLVDFLHMSTFPSPALSSSSLSVSDKGSPTLRVKAPKHHLPVQANGHNQTHFNGDETSYDNQPSNTSFDDVFKRTQDNQYNEAHEQLAKEFGVEAHLVQALMQRLSTMC
jgi:hypothetical protein